MTNLAARIPRIPRSCIWEITTACNLRCIHCELDADGRDPDELTTDEALALALDLAEAGCESVSLTGGEPLLRSDWPLLARTLAERGVEVVLVSNGTRVDEAVIRHLVEAKAAGISISLDGLKDRHDAIRVPQSPMPSRFDAAISAIERLVESRRSARTALKVAVITQVHRGNLSELAAMFDLVAELGVDAWQIQLAFPLGRALRIPHPYILEPSALPLLQRQLAGFIRARRVSIVVADNIGYYGPWEPVLRRSVSGEATFWTGCMAGCLGVAIGSNGDVKGCPSHSAAFVVGNVRTERFATIWNDRGRFAYNTQWQEELLAGGCARCRYRRLCRAGCTSMAYAVTGTIYDNPFCVQRAGG